MWDCWELLQCSCSFPKAEEVGHLKGHASLRLGPWGAHGAMWPPPEGWHARQRVPGPQHHHHSATCRSYNILHLNGACVRAQAPKPAPRGPEIRCLSRAQHRKLGIV